VDASPRILAGVTAAVLTLGACEPAGPPDDPVVTPAAPGADRPYTREERALFREAVRRVEASELRRAERKGTPVARRPVVLSTEAGSIKSFQDDAAEIVLRRCIDEPDAGAPVVQEVVVVRYENRTWRIRSSTTTDEPC
jgi:hypothetical protein